MARYVHEQRNIPKDRPEEYVQVPGYLGDVEAKATIPTWLMVGGGALGLWWLFKKKKKQ